MELTSLGNLREQRRKLAKLLARPLSAINTADADVLALSREAVAQRLADIDAEIHERMAGCEKPNDVSRMAE